MSDDAAPAADLMAAPPAGGMDSGLHFTRGFLGWSARVLLKIRSWGDRYDETVMGPAFIGVLASSLCDRGKVSDLTVEIIYLSCCVLSGAYLGAIWGFVGNVRAMLRGLLVGALTAGGITATTTVARSGPELRIFGVSIAVATMMIFLFGQMITGTLSDFVLVPEDQWRRAAPRRASTWRVVRITLGTEKLEGASELQAIAVGLLRIVAAIALYKLLFWLGFPLPEIDKFMPR